MTETSPIETTDIPQPVPAVPVRKIIVAGVIVVLIIIVAIFQDDPNNQTYCLEDLASGDG